MKRTSSWTMAGTAWTQVLSADASFPVAPPRWSAPPGWNDIAPESEGGPSRTLCQLAWELARLVPASKPTAEVAQRAVYRLAWAMLELAAQGSTVLPLTTEGRAHLAKMLERLPADAEAEAVMAQVLAGKVPPALKGVVGASGDCPILVSGGTVILHRYERMEQRLAESLRRQVQAPPIGGDDYADLEKAVKAVRATLKADEAWTNEQQVAVLNGATLPFSVISGGPGTGKTTIVVSLLRVLVRLGVPVGNIALAAPTGKAANRLYEVVQAQLKEQPAAEDQALLSLPEPRTLHRLLGYHAGGDSFRHHEDNPLEQDVVIVDECSMVDLFLMDQLFRAASPRGEGGRPRRLVLLGDGHQLPSVEAGMVLHHLADEDGAAPPLLRRPWHALVTAKKDDPELKWAKGASGLRSRFLVTLTRSHRMRLDNAAGAAVYRCASAIRAGQAEALVPPAPEAPVPRAEVGALKFSGVEHLGADLTEHEPAGFFEAWWQQRLLAPASFEGKELAVEALQGHTFKLEGAMVGAGEAPKMKALLHTVEAQRILCLNRGKGPSGAETANAWFAKRRESVRKELEAKGEAIPLQHQRLRGFFAGEPVLFLQNDYVLKLFNGDHGVLAWTRRGAEAPRLRAVFARASGYEAFDLEAVHGQMQRAYALTVHKAQGSQVDYAALLLPAEAENPLLVNQLVYTAVSRATTSVVIVGNLERLKEATLRPVVRYCGVVERVGQV